MRMPLRVAILVSAGLAQIGEFSFLLLDEAAGFGLLDPTVEARLLATAVVSMLLTPFVIAAASPLAERAARVRWLRRVYARPEPAESRGSARDYEGHVVIAGYGLTGQELALALQRCGAAFVVVDLNPDNVARARAAGQKALFGDVTSPLMLEKLGVARARELVIAVNDPNAAERALRAVRQTAPHLPVLVRVPFLADVAGMRSAGADEVVPMELESAAEVIERVLRRSGAVDERVAAALADLHARHGCAQPGAAQASTARLDRTEAGV
jgi:CPA2 family monovalent cation:H+ antiporter-2